MIVVSMALVVVPTTSTSRSVAGAEPGGSVAAEEAAPTSDSVDEALIHHSVSVRKAFGFPADEEYVRSVADRPSVRPAVEADGLILTPSEFEEYRVRTDMAERRSDAVEAAMATGRFAGGYVTDGGALTTLLLTGATSADTAHMKDRFPYPERLRVTSAEFTLDELIGATDRIADQWLSPAARSDEIYGVGPDVINNRVVVRHGKISDTTMAAIRASTRAPVVFEVSGPAVGQSCSNRANCNSPQRAGVKINNGGNCSSGFVARTSSGNEVVLTAGHCWFGFTNVNVNSGDAGYFGTVQYGNALANNSSADARLIETVNSTTSNKLYFSDSNMSRTVGAKHTNYWNAFPGDIVCIFAYPVQAGSTCGEITDTYQTATFTSPCACTLKNQVFASYLAYEGTSGGAIGSPNGYTAVGSHVGCFNTGGTCLPVSKRIFSHITHVQSALNVNISFTD